MPEGSSSAAPVMRPGPRALKKRRTRLGLDEAGIRCKDTSSPLGSPFSVSVPGSQFSASHPFGDALPNQELENREPQCCPLPMRFASRMRLRRLIRLAGAALMILLPGIASAHLVVDVEVSVRAPAFAA